ncbi:uncharacterized protein LOC111999657 [Quercus suber]|uniref:uncharacterized protein LOC111999657 n=1 Tax=Quercus suber TaxID=58331 RepID=UPI000CE25153|nr:uncharacterized protein LOC111999657 [Quercus suber]
MVDAAAGGALTSNTHEVAYELLEKLASNNYQWPTERAMPRKTAGVLELDSITSLAAQMATLSQQLGKMNVNAIQTNVVCDHCTGNHSSVDCQIGQLSSMLTKRTLGTLSSNTVTNSEEHAKPISLRSGQTYEEPKATNAKQDEAVDNEELEMKEVEQAEKTKENGRASKSKKSREQLHINIPFIEALAQMPKYAKFLKDIISKKRKLEEHEIVMLTEESSAILQKKLPPKLKDPGSFTIPCTIGKSYFDRALFDLGASINLMPLSVFRKLGLREVKLTTISLQLADRSFKYPRGVIEDVLVKVDKFIFPADFIVLDMD